MLEALTLWIVVGTLNGSFVGSKVFESQAQCEQVRTLLAQNYPDVAVSKCIAIPVYGTGAVRETNEAP